MISDTAVRALETVLAKAILDTTRKVENSTLLDANYYEFTKMAAKANTPGRHLPKIVEFLCLELWNDSIEWAERVLDQQNKTTLCAACGVILVWGTEATKDIATKQMSHGLCKVCAKKAVENILEEGKEDVCESKLQDKERVEGSREEG